jgi:hypothetical protein
MCEEANSPFPYKIKHKNRRLAMLRYAESKISKHLPTLTLVSQLVEEPVLRGIVDRNDIRGLDTRAVRRRRTTGGHNTDDLGQTVAAWASGKVQPVNCLSPVGGGLSICWSRNVLKLLSENDTVTAAVEDRHIVFVEVVEADLLELIIQRAEARSARGWDVVKNGTGVAHRDIRKGVDEALVVGHLGGDVEELGNGPTARLGLDGLGSSRGACVVLHTAANSDEGELLEVGVGQRELLSCCLLAHIPPSSCELRDKGAVPPVCGKPLSIVGARGKSEKAGKAEVMVLSAAATRMLLVKAILVMFIDIRLLAVCLAEKAAKNDKR